MKSNLKIATGSNASCQLTLIQLLMNPTGPAPAS
jgi:hypothetical protein